MQWEEQIKDAEKPRTVTKMAYLHDGQKINQIKVKVWKMPKNYLKYLEPSGHRLCNRSALCATIGKSYSSFSLQTQQNVPVNSQKQSPYTQTWRTSGSLYWTRAGMSTVSQCQNPVPRHQALTLTSFTWLPDIPIQELLVLIVSKSVIKHANHPTALGPWRLFSLMLMSLAHANKNATKLKISKCNMFNKLAECAIIC